MNEEMEVVIDLLLREQFEGPVPDDGFCDHVMARLPASRRSNTWPLAAGTLAGLTTCWFSLWFSPIAYVGWCDWFTGELSASAIVLFISTMSMSILALAWTIAEADDTCRSRPHCQTAISCLPLASTQSRIGRAANQSHTRQLMAQIVN